MNSNLRDVTILLVWRKVGESWISSWDKGMFSFTFLINSQRSILNPLEQILLTLSSLGQGLLQPGHRTRPKNSKTPFFSRYFKFLPVGNSNGSKTSPKFFSRKNSRNYSHQPHLKFLLFLAGNLSLMQLDPQNFA